MTARRAVTPGLLLGLALMVGARGADTTAPPPESTLDDLLDSRGIVSAALSPDGKVVATIMRSERGDRIVVQDPLAGEPTVVSRIGVDDAGADLETRVTDVYWKTNDRLLFRVAVLPPTREAEKHLKLGNLQKVGKRLFSIRRDGTGLVRLLQDNDEPALYLAFDLGSLRSLMPSDPNHVLLIASGYNGRSLFEVDVNTGRGRLVEAANAETWDWWPDLDGRPLVRVDTSFGVMRYFRRTDGGDWKKFYSVKLRDIKPSDEYEQLGPSARSGSFFVLARPDGAERRAIYLHDLAGADLGAPLVQNAVYDIASADVSRDGRHIARYCYVAHVRVCESPDPVANDHLAWLRGRFGVDANVNVIADSADGRAWLLRVEGPSEPPAYHFYRLDSRLLKRIGPEQQALVDKALPTAAPLEYAARDGLRITGYLTRPPGAAQRESLPLVVLPHGGPESRDQLTFDATVQFLAARGYAVFQPNFRGSDGLGATFAASGRGQWGRAMQDDITDGVRLLVERKIADPARICIVGASYGGYAALAGATLTPELYRCAISLSGPADLAAFLKYRAKRHGKNSELYSYWKQQIGDPTTDAARIAEISPALHVDRIKADILLIHGDEDEVVPYSQSHDFQRRLQKSGRDAQLVTLAAEGHDDWSRQTWRTVLLSIDRFLGARIGPGYAPAR